MYVTLPNQFKPVQQSRKQQLRVYCPNIHTLNQVELLLLLKFPAVYSRVTSDITPLFDRFYFIFIICLIIAVMSKLISLCHLCNVVKAYVKSHLTFLFTYLISRYICLKTFQKVLSLTLKKSLKVTGLQTFNSKSDFIVVSILL